MVLRVRRLGGCVRRFGAQPVTNGSGALRRRCPRRPSPGSTRTPTGHRQPNDAVHVAHQPGTAARPLRATAGRATRRSPRARRPSTDQTSDREPCAERVCRRHLPADGQHVQAHRAGSEVMVGAGEVVCRLNCHRREQRVHTELRHPEAENHHRGADPTPEHGPGRGEDECTDQCNPAHGGQLAARPAVGGHGAGHDRARGEGSARGHGVIMPGAARSVLRVYA